MTWTVIAHHALQGIGCLAGALLMCAALLYPPQRLRVHDWLGNFWIRVDDQAKGLKSKVRGFIVEVSRAAEKVIDRIFGKAKFSLQFLYSSFSLAMGSLVIEQRIQGVGGDTGDWWQVFLIFCSPAIVIAIIGFRGVVRVAAYIFLGLFVLVIAVLVIHDYTRGYADGWNLSKLQGIATAIVLSVAPDMLCLFVSRRLIRKAVSGGAVTPLLVWEAVTLVSCLFLSLLAPHIDESGDLYTLFATRWFLIGFAAIFLVIAVVVLIYRCLPYVLGHLIYPLHETEVAKKPKTLFTCGLALIGFSIKGGDFVEFAGKLAEKFG